MFKYFAFLIASLRRVKIWHQAHCKNLNISWICGKIFALFRDFPHKKHVTSHNKISLFFIDCWKLFWFNFFDLPRRRIKNISSRFINCECTFINFNFSTLWRFFVTHWNFEISSKNFFLFSFWFHISTRWLNHSPKKWWNLCVTFDRRCFVKKNYLFPSNILKKNENQILRMKKNYPPKKKWWKYNLETLSDKCNWKNAVALILYMKIRRWKHRIKIGQKKTLNAVAKDKKNK